MVNNNSLWFVGWTVLLQLISVNADYSDTTITVRSTVHCLNVFIKDPKSYADSPHELENQPFSICPDPSFNEQIARVSKIWYTFGFDRTDVKTLPLTDEAQWQRSYEISTDTGEIVFDADYCITPDSKTTPWVAQPTVCPPCSKRDVRANGDLISETNPYVTGEYPRDGPDSPALLSTCNHDGRTLGTLESSLPAAGMNEFASSRGGGSSSSSSSSSPSEEQFNLQSDTAVTGLQVVAAPAPIGNDGSYIYADPLNNKNNNNDGAGSAGSSSSNFLNTNTPTLPKLTSDGSPSSELPYIDQFDSTSTYRTTPTLPSENTTPDSPEQVNFAIQGRRKIRKRAQWSSVPF